MLRSFFNAMSCLLATAGVAISLPGTAYTQPVIFSVETHRGTDTLYVGEHAFISFDVNGQGAQIVSLVWPLQWSFGAGSIVGATPGDAQLDFQMRFYNGFGGPSVIDLKGTDPDTLVLGVVSFNEGPWITSGSEWAARLHFQPKAAGQITIDSIFYLPANTLAALSPLGENFAIEWHSPGITVLPCPNVLGDVNQSGTVTSADVILFVNCVFLCDFGYHEILELGDVDCNGVATVSDVIHMVNYVFKGMPLPFCCKVPD